MTSFATAYQFTEAGLDAFKKIMLGQLPDTAISPTDPQFASKIVGTGPVDCSPAASARELAQRVLNSLGPRWPGMLGSTGTWAWLTFVFRDIVFPKNEAGQRKPGEFYRWFPSDPGDYRKAQRHLVRMPTVLLGNLGHAADHLLCGPPHVHGEMREQLTSQQDMFNAEFQKAARALYFSESTGKLKRGTGSKTAGTPRRLAKVRQQLDVTWDLFELDAPRILNLLPKEFDKFKAA